MSAHSAREGGAARRARHPGEEEHENTERWLVSYSDMITVLVALFVVLFAMSSIDAGKYQQLKESFVAVSDQAGKSVTNGATGPLPGADASDGKAGDPAVEAIPGIPLNTPASTLKAAEDESARLKALQNQMAGALAGAGLSDRVAFRIEARGLVIGMVSDDVFFSSGSATLSDVAIRVLDTLGPTLAAGSDQLSVEGNANILPTNGKYATNWELSSDRAVQVLRRLVEADHVAGPRISAVGYGDTRPLKPGTDDVALATNRRVDLVVLSSAPEAVRNLLPALAAAGR